MFKCFAAVAATIAIFFCAALLTSGRVEAGASASAPSKYAHANKVASQQAQLRAGRNDFGITEYSSSSARSRRQQH
jgi:hypothetical protein